MTYYNCTDGESLDAICKDFYGFSRGSVEAVLSHENNRELSKKLPVLNHGDVVFLPPVSQPTKPETQETNLWG
jgi:phage tail protein X